MSKYLRKKKYKNGIILKIIISLAIIGNMIAAVGLTLSDDNKPRVKSSMSENHINASAVPNPMYTLLSSVEQFNINKDIINIKNWDDKEIKIADPDSKTIAIEPEIEAIEPEIVVETKKEAIPKITKNTDLCAPIDITVEEMDAYISAFGETELKGYGQYFMDASELTGFNPLYLFAHASFESGFGSSNLAKKKGNYFGIGAYDRDPYGMAYTMGNTMYDGIVQGASWIKDKYYNEGQTTLYGMIYGGKCYASAKDHWINSIISLANQKLHIINENREVNT